MNIIDESKRDTTSTPNAVGTPNATQDVYRHVKPGRKRANFFRYFRFNLPRLTKALLLGVIAVIGICAGDVARSGFLPFEHADIPLWLVVGFAALYLALGLGTKRAIWDYGSFIASAACIIYIGGVFYGHPPFVWNGASIGLAASWNLMFFASLGYFVLNWAVNFGILVVWPDTQGFTD